jgi:parallel beta-helix repeat protein
MKLISITMTFALLLLAGIASQAVQAATFYVSAATGSDAGDGSQAKPWKSLTHAVSVVESDAVINVEAGQYGAISITSPANRSSYVTLKGDPMAPPEVTGVNVAFASRASAFLRIEGFLIKPDHRNGGIVVNVSNATNVQIVGNTITTIKYAKEQIGKPGIPFTFEGVYIKGSSDVVVASNRISDVFRGVQVATSSNVTIRNNYITPQAGSGIQYLSGNSAVVIEDNHIHGQSYVPYPTDPDGPNDPHASLISIRSNDVTIRRNIMHGMGSSSGIMTYLPDATGGLSAYSNIVIENNLIYDVTNSSVIRLYNAANNIVLRNNLIASQLRKDSATCDGVTNDARYRYNAALVVHSLAAGSDGSGIKLYNNILIGSVSPGPMPVERNNIMWSYLVGTVWSTASPSNTSKIIVSSYLGCGKHPRYFETTFFSETVDYSPKHGKHHDFKLADSSEGQSFGDESLQPVDSIGAIGPDGFIRSVGPARSAVLKAVGPRVRGDGSPTSPPDAPSLNVE